MSRDGTFHILGFECFSGSLRVIVFLSESTFIHSSRLASPRLIAVSLSNSKNAESFFPEAEIKASISCSVGINGML